ncbi:MAG: hypothetical protein K2O88_06690 [Paramuribaculum sp.]|nr:hypothetical protein [Paramuribaculum sp.]
MFDETEAIEFIRTKIVQELSALYSDDDILNIIDAIWDCYEENGLLEIDCDDEDDTIPVDEIHTYVDRMMRKDKGCRVSPDHINTIVDAELEYELTLSD